MLTLPPAQIRLDNGRIVRLSRERPEDLAEIVAFVKGLSVGSRHARFLGCLSAQSLEDEIDRELEPSPSSASLIARDEESGRIVAHAFAAETRPYCAEIAFAVADGFQHRGIGTWLLRWLVYLARERGLTRLEADTFGDNSLMFAVFRESGYPIRQALRDGVAHVTLDISRPAAE